MQETGSLRDAVVGDNTQLIELTKKSPMIGSITVCADRKPDFFTLPNLQGENSRVVVYVRRGEILGNIVLIRRNEYWSGRLSRVLHAGDLRVDSTKRGSKISRYLVDEYFNELLNGDYDGGGFEILEDNKRGLSVLKMIPKDVSCKSLGKAQIYQVLNIFPQYVSKKYSYRRAKPEDLKSLSHLLTSFYKNHDGVVSFSPEDLERLFNEDPSFAIDNMFVAEINGKMVACLGVWDQFSFRRTVVEKFSSVIRNTIRLLHIFRPILPLPPLPSEGAPLKYAFIRMPAHESSHMHALIHLNRFVLRSLRREKKYQFIWMSFHEKDPLNQMAKGLLKLKLAVKLFHLTPPKARSQPANKIPYIDFSLV